MCDAGTTVSAMETGATDPRTRLTRRAIIVWAGAVLFYIVAITGRTSFGVAGVHAIERFEVDASRIAVFTVVQVGVYALAQIPTGLLIDRFAPKRVLLAGALIMAAGQILLGFTDVYWVALLARVLIGAGDASAFLSVMRILPYWFPLRWTPLFTQLTASLGQLGQFISAVPFLALLNAQGWSTAFISLGAVGILVALAAGVAVSDNPDSGSGDNPAGATGDGSDTKTAQTDIEATRSFWENLAFVLRHPVCWQAFFIHYSSMLFQIIFTLLWGSPLILLGMGMGSAEVGLVLTINTVTSVLAGPVMGFVSQRSGRNRDIAAFLSALTIGITWIVFFLPTEPRGLVALIVVNVIMAFFTTTSNFGFDGVRERLPRTSVATGTGLGNMGGFAAAMIASQLVGLLLDFSSDGQAYGWEDFRLAWGAVIGMWALGLIGSLVSRAAVKRRDRGTPPIKVVDEG